MNAPVPKFSARDIFDPKSFYNRLRSDPEPERKLRGLFDELHALREAQRPSAIRLAAASNRNLVLQVDDPVRYIDASVTETFIQVGPSKTRLLLSVQVIDETDYPAPKTRCRAFLLTKGMIEHLCGPDTLQSGNWTRTALQHLFEEGGNQDPSEIAWVLSAAPEMSGEFGPGGESVFPRFDLPPQSTGFRSIPEVVAIVVVIDRPMGETNP
jgi:hypothetical protein